MKNLKAKLRKNGGFTLIEMLIVVAIIAILIAVSIPLVGSALEKAREATDAANERAFKAELTTCYLAGTIDGKEPTDANKFSTTTVYSYDAVNGKLLADGSKISPYGQSTATKGVDDTPRQGLVLCGKIDGNGELTMGWVEPAATPTVPTTSNLIGDKISKTTKTTT